MVQVHLHVIGCDEKETFWMDAKATDFQKKKFGENAFTKIMKHFLMPVCPSWADGECFEIRFK